MRAFRWYGAASAAALATCLAGCAGNGSSIAPVGGGTSASASRSVVGMRGAALDPSGFPGNRTAVLSENRFTSLRADSNSGAVLFASDNTTGNLDEFTEDNPTNPTSTCSGCGGWGLAVSPGVLGNAALLAVGKSGGTVEIYNTLTGTLNHVSSLTLSGKGAGTNALGICFDRSGGLYADNWPSNTVDYFRSPKAGGSPTKTLTVKAYSVLSYLACDFDKIGKSGENYLMGYGYNNSDLKVNVDSINPVSGAATREQTLGSIAQSNGFPGGLAIDANDDLVANNQYGKLYDINNTEPWKGAIKQVCTWVFQPNDWKSIAFDDTQQEIWAGNLLFSGEGQYAISTTFPLTNGQCSSPGESGGPSTEQSGETQGYNGIAVYPNAGV
jgi:hypothetical protein